MPLIPRGSVFDMDRLLNDFWAPTAGEAQGVDTFFAPRVDVKEAEGYYDITAELPGVEKDDVQVTLHDGVLTIEAHVESDDKEESEGTIIRQERRYGKFMRRFNLGEDVHEEEISASFKNGILHLRAPKHKPKAPERRRIDIS